MKSHPSRPIPHTSSSDGAADISFSSEHNHFMGSPYPLLSSNAGAVEKHIGSSDIPFISAILDWDQPDFPFDIPLQSNQIQEEDGGIFPSDDLLDQELITDDENPLMSTLLNDFFLDTSSTPPSMVQEPTMQSQFQQPQVVLHQTSPIVRTASSNSNSCTSNNTATTAKGRVRWTPELHEAFVEAVNQLGGMENAKPKAVLKYMKVEGLTIYHVKSHLQKYRTARHVPEPSQGSRETKLTPVEHVTSLDTKSGMYITEALRIQMEVQKQLHEQLEIQRKMQLQIEAQGKALLMMIGKQHIDFGQPEQEEEADSRLSKRPRRDESRGNGRS